MFAGMQFLHVTFSTSLSRTKCVAMQVNLVALVIAFVAAVSNGGALSVLPHAQQTACAGLHAKHSVRMPWHMRAETPLNVLELLWVNLIMDAMAALGASAFLMYHSVTSCHGSAPSDHLASRTLAETHALGAQVGVRNALVTLRGWYKPKP